MPKFYDYGQDRVYLSLAHYANGTVAVRMTAVDENGFEEPFATLTVNLVDETGPNKVDVAFIDAPNLDWGGSDILSWLIRNRIAEFLNYMGSSGWNRRAYPLVRFTKEALEGMEAW